MNKSQYTVWNNKTARQFTEAVFSIETILDLQNFLRDVMTKKEIEEISMRFEAAKMLNDGTKYTDIVGKTKLSSRTVARISDWLQNGCNGYEVAINNLASTHKHT